MRSPACNHERHTATESSAEVTVPGPADDGGLRRDWIAPFSVDVRLTLIVHRRGPRDPTLRVDSAGAIWRTSLTPAGPGTLRLASGREPGPAAPGQVATPVTVVRAHAWGAGADWLLAKTPDLLGVRDRPAEFRPEHPRLRELASRLHGLRIGRTDRVLEALVPAVLEQKVVGLEAQRAWRRLLVWRG